MKNKTILLFILLWAGPSLVSAGTITVKPVKPVHLPTLKFFTDKKEADYLHPYPPEESRFAVLFKKNKRWADLKLRGEDKSGVYIGVAQQNLVPYLEKGALQFYIRGNKGGETLSGVGFTMAADKKHPFHYASIVPLGDYCAVSTKWQVITIPLDEFPRSGTYVQIDEKARQFQKAMNLPISNSNDQTFVTRFDWSKVIEVKLEHSADDNPETEIEISNVVILPQYKLRAVLKEKEDMQ